MIKAIYHFLGETIEIEYETMTEFRTHYNNSKVSSDFVFNLDNGKILIVPSYLMRNVELEELG